MRVLLSLAALLIVLFTVMKLVQSQLSNLSITGAPPAASAAPGQTPGAAPGVVPPRVSAQQAAEQMQRAMQEAAAARASQPER